MSSYNIELVHIILKAVSEYTVGTPKSKDDYKVYQGYDFKNKNTFTIECVQIANYKNWDIAQVNEDSEGGKNQKLFTDQSDPHAGLARRKTDEMDKQNNTAADTLTINEDIVVTEFAPDVFSFLRIKDGYSNKTLEVSLDPEKNKEKVFKAGESQGKSGSFFFFSQD